MKIEYDKARLEVTKEEATILYYALKSSLLRLIREHWKDHPQAFQSDHGVNSKLEMMKKLSPFCNDSYEYDRHEVLSLQSNLSTP